ncbi:hypothetical protein [Streptomyces sp. NPDC002573]
MPIPVSPSQPAAALHSEWLIPGYSAHWWKSSLFPLVMSVKSDDGAF